MSQKEKSLAVRAMKAAARQGFDPYNSHKVQAAKWTMLARLSSIPRK